MPSFHVFAEMDLLGSQADADSFGAKSADEFRLTSSFLITQDVKAFAVVQGTVLLQQVTGDSSLVNLIIKPLAQSKINFPSVKYFIYRGLKAADFISGGSVVASGSEFINEINRIQQARNQTLQGAGQPTETIPLEALFGFNLSPLPDTLLDKFFFRENENAQLHTAKIGMYLGNFKSNTKIGFEIVVENPGYLPDVAMAKKPEHVLIGATGNTLDKRHLRETVLNFVDPAAYYGMHLDDGLGVGYRDSSNANNGDKKERDIYELIIGKFATRNKVYLDIRNENGYSLNYYNNYQAPDLPTNLEIRIGDSLGVVIKAEYYSQGWPFHVLSNPGDAVLGEIYLELPVNDNARPLVYIEHGNIRSAHEENFIKDEHLSGGVAGWTKTVSIKINHIPTLSTTEKTVSSIVRLVYIKQIDPAAVPISTVVPTNSYTDNVFGPLTVFPGWETTNPLVWMSKFHRKYVDATSVLTVLYRKASLILSVNTIERKIKVSGDITTSILYADTVIIEGASQDYGPFRVLSATLVSGSTEITVVENILLDPPMGHLVYYQARKIDRIDNTAKKITLTGIDLSAEIQADDDIVVVDISEKKFNYQVQTRTFTGGNTEIVIKGNFKKHGFGCVMETGVAVEPNRVVFYATPLEYCTQDFPERFSMSRSLIGGTSKTENIILLADDLFTQTDFDFEFIKPSTSEELPFIGLTETTDQTQGRKIASNFFALGLTRGGAGGEVDRLLTAGVSLSNFHYQFLTLVETSAQPHGTDIYGFRFKKYEVKIAGYNVSGNFTTFSASPPVEVYSAYSSRRIFHSLAYSLQAFNQIPLVYEETFSFRAAVTTILAADANMQSIVDSFVTGISQIVSLNRPAIGALVVDKGRAIWRTALNSAKANGIKPHDDRPLYWARLKMRVAIRTHAEIKKYPRALFDFIKLLESVSRGYDEVSFASAPAGAKKILISGYDPFQLSSKIDRSNPSGAAALTLNGKTIFNNDTPVAFIQSVVFPVRFRDFDMNGGEGVVEELFKRFIKPPDPNVANPVFMIMTLSQGGFYEFWVDRFPSRTRGTGSDNEGEKGGKFPPSVRGDQFYETTLPFSKIVPAIDSGSFKIYFNNSFEYKYPGSVVNKNWPSNTNKRKIEDSPRIPPVDLLLPSELTEATAIKKSEITAIQGSGGDYLSNEIFYRVSLLRSKINPVLPTGHYHVPFIQEEEFDRALTAELIQVIEDSIKKASI